jgi:hypothetical protein
VTEARWTAPASGTYLFVSGQEPRLLTDEEAQQYRDGVTQQLAEAETVQLYTGPDLIDSAALKAARDLAAMAHPGYQRAKQAADDFTAAMDRLVKEAGVAPEGVERLRQGVLDMAAVSGSHSPTSMADVLTRILTPPQDGPPYTHTFQHPEPVPVLDDDGQPVLDETGEPVMQVPLLPTHTITEFFAAEESLSMWGRGNQPGAREYTGVLSYLEGQQ